MARYTVYSCRTEHESFAKLFIPTTLSVCLLVFLLSASGSAHPVNTQCSSLSNTSRPAAAPSQLPAPVCAAAFVPVILLLTTTATSIALGPCESFVRRLGCHYYHHSVVVAELAELAIAILVDAALHTVVGSYF